MLTGKIVKQLDVPGEPGEWVRIRMLSGLQLEAAREARTRAVLANLRAAGGDLMRDLQGMSRDEADAEIEADPLAAYDVGLLLRAGVVGWSYADKLTPQAIDDLDDETRQWAAREILALCRRTEADRKNS